jgi:hypothetical protein
MPCDEPLNAAEREICCADENDSHLYLIHHLASLEIRGEALADMPSAEKGERSIRRIGFQASEKCRDAWRNNRIRSRFVIPIPNPAVAVPEKEIARGVCSNDAYLFARPPWRFERSPISVPNEASNRHFAIGKAHQASLMKVFERPIYGVSGTQFGIAPLVRIASQQKDIT